MPLAHTLVQTGGKFQLNLFVLILTWLIGEAARCLAGRLAGCLAFAAAAVLCAFSQIAGLQSLNSFHVDFLRLKNLSSIIYLILQCSSRGFTISLTFNNNSLQGYQFQQRQPDFERLPGKRIFEIIDNSILFTVESKQGENIEGRGPYATDRRDCHPSGE